MNNNPPNIAIDPQPQESFPCTVMMNGAPIVLNADGTFKGNVEAFEQGVAALKGDGLMVVLAWLLLREIKRDK